MSFSETDSDFRTVYLNLVMSISIYPDLAVRLKFKGNQVYLRTIKKLKSYQLYELRIRMRFSPKLGSE